MSEPVGTDGRPVFPGAFCCLCGNTNVADLGQVIGICLDAEACHRRQAERKAGQ